METVDRPLTEMELEKISYLFSKMSLSAKHSFIVKILTSSEVHFQPIINKLGDQYEKIIIRA